MSVKSVQDELLNFFKVNNIDAEALRRNEKWKMQQMWRETFAADVKAKTGKWIYKGNDWHAFNYGFALCLRGARAIESFNNRRIDGLYFVSSNDNIQAYRCISIGVLIASQFIVLLDTIPELIDLYLFPESFEWTMVIVHEPNMGPFFAEK